MYDRLGSDDDDCDSEDEDDVNDGGDDEDDDIALHARSTWIQAQLRKLMSECNIYQIPIFY